MCPRQYDPDFYLMFFPLPRTPEPGTLTSLVTDGFSQHWTTLPDGQVERCRYNGRITNGEWGEVSTDDALSDLETSNSGSLNLFTDLTDFILATTDTYDRDDLPSTPGLRLSWERVHLKHANEEILEEVFETAAFVFEHLSSPFAFSRIPADSEYDTTVTRGDVDVPKLPDIYWMTLLSKPLVESIGRSRLESAPVWMGEPLDDGGFGLVVTDNPGDYWPEDKERVKKHLGLGD